MNVDLAAPFVGILSLSAFGFAGINLAVELTTPPIVEGYASYDAQVRSGEIVPLEWMIKKQRWCPGEASRIWEGEDGYYFATNQTATGLPATGGEWEPFIVPLEIPPMVPVGNLVLTVSGFYDCPNEQRQYFLLGPVEFTVVDGKDGS